MLVADSPSSISRDDVRLFDGQFRLPVLEVLFCFVSSQVHVVRLDVPEQTRNTLPLDRCAATP